MVAVAVAAVAVAAVAVAAVAVAAVVVAVPRSRSERLFQKKADACGYFLH